MADSQTAAAKFSVHGAERVSGVSASLLTSPPPTPEKAIDLSSTIARRLYDVTLKDQRISDGTLAVARCRAMNESGMHSSFVTLLKLDPSQGFRAVEVTRPGGEIVLELEAEPDILPNPKERIQKAAFIRLVPKEGDYDLLVLDRQTPPGIARFFLGDFLGAELFFGPAERTEQLFRTLVNARNTVADDLSGHQLAALEQFIDGAVVARSVNVDTLIEGLPVPEQVRARIEGIVAQALPDREFELDRSTADKFLRERTFQADNGVRVRIPAEFYDEMVTIEDIPGSNPPTRRVIIKTRQWKER